MSDWTDEVRQAVDALEEKYDVSLCSGEHCDELAEKIEALKAENEELLAKYERASESCESLEGELECREELMVLKAKQEGMMLVLGKKIFSGEESRKMWLNINNLGSLHTCEDVGAVFYEICCKLQQLESKYDNALAMIAKAKEE